MYQHNRIRGGILKPCRDRQAVEFRRPVGHGRLDGTLFAQPGGAMIVITMVTPAIAAGDSIMRLTDNRAKSLTPINKQQRHAASSRMTRRPVID